MKICISIANSLFAVIVFLAINDADVAFSQFQCPPGSRLVPGGGGMMCQCPDGSYAGMYTGCPQQAAPSPSIPPGSVRCGSGFCPAGTKCSRQTRCIALDAVDCGSFVCPASNQCTRRGCLPPGAVTCGQGFCNAGLQCENGQCVALGRPRTQSQLMRLLTGLGTSQSSQALAISGKQTIASAVQQRNVQLAPSAYGIERLISDPYRGQPVSPSQLPRPPATKDLFWPNIPHAQTPQKNPMTTPLPPHQGGVASSTVGCGSGFREVTKGSFSYCELWLVPAAPF
jgi:hypothetical protein